MGEQHDFHLDAGFWRVTALLTVISVGLCIGMAYFPLDQLLPEGTEGAGQIDLLFRVMCIMSLPVMTAVYGYIIYFVIKYRRRPGEPLDSVGSQLHDHAKLEAAWTIVPSLMMVAIGVYSYFVISSYQEAVAGTPTLEAIGHTYYYEFRYPGLKNSVPNELHLPVNKAITLYVTSAEADEKRAVLHAFWVPEFRVKQDMVPGMAVPVHFKPTNIGEYRIICTVYCGLGHSGMHGKVIVQSQADFDKWFAEQQRGETAGTTQVALAPGDAAAGKTLFDQKCTACHNAAPFDQKKVGPGLANLFADAQHPKLVNGKPATPENVGGILHTGFQGDMGTMPSQQANALSEKDIADLVAYLKTLK